MRKLMITLGAGLALSIGATGAMADCAYGTIADSTLHPAPQVMANMDLSAPNVEPDAGLQIILADAIQEEDGFSIQTPMLIATAGPDTVDLQAILDALTVVAEVDTVTMPKAVFDLANALELGTPADLPIIETVVAVIPEVGYDEQITARQELTIAHVTTNGTPGDLTEGSFNDYLTATLQKGLLDGEIDGAASDGIYLDLATMESFQGGEISGDGGTAYDFVLVASIGAQGLTSTIPGAATGELAATYAAVG